MIGLIFNALFATHEIIELDGVSTSTGGWMDHNWKQLYIQFAYVCATTAFTFVVTAVLAKIFDMIPGLQLRCTDEGETLGIDEIEVTCTPLISSNHY